MADETGKPSRECPFCRETIHAEAIKCRHCASMLVPLPAEPPKKDPEADADDGKILGKPGHIMVMVDKDLIRFGKVAAAFLSLIVVVGAALTGLDLKNAASDANKAANDAKTSLNDIQQSRQQVEDLKNQLSDEQSKVKTQLAEMQTTINFIQSTLPAAREIELTSKALSAQGASSPGKSNPTTGPPGAQGPLTVPQVARLYNFPANLNGEGQNIAMIELGGGYRPADMQTYFSSLNLPVPAVSVLGVDGASNNPTTALSADDQVDLDLEVAGAVAPKAHFSLCFAPNTPVGFVDAVRTATNDKAYPPSILLIDWGSPEKTWTAGSLHQLDNALHDAALRGITVIAASGDQGATDGTSSPAVDFPSSSPSVLSVGGTRLSASHDKIVSEVVWNNLATNSGATGGGVSAVFLQPEWQKDAHLPPFNGQTGRGIPDVAANADPGTGYAIRVDGQWAVLGGTTAASPLWAGLVALLNQGLGRRLGNINPALYKTAGPAGAFNDITQGTNATGSVSGCKAGPGWDYCTGWGTPNGSKLLTALRNAK